MKALLSLGHWSDPKTIKRMPLSGKHWRGRAAETERRVPWILGEGRLHGLVPGRALVLQAAFLLEQVPVHARLQALEQGLK